MDPAPLRAGPFQDPADHRDGGSSFAEPLAGTDGAMPIAGRWDRAPALAYFFFSPPILTVGGAAAITFGFSFFGFFASLFPRN